MIAANLDNVALIEKRGASMRQVVGPHGDGCDCGGGHLYIEEDGWVWQTGKNEVGVGARRGQAAVQCGLNIAPSTHATSRPAWLSRLPPDKSCLHVHPAILQSGKETISSNSKWWLWDRFALAAGLAARQLDATSDNLHCRSRTTLLSARYQQAAHVAISWGIQYSKDVTWHLITKWNIAVFLTIAQ